MEQIPRFEKPLALEEPLAPVTPTLKDRLAQKLQANRMCNLDKTSNLQAKTDLVSETHVSSGVGRHYLSSVLNTENIGLDHVCSNIYAKPVFEDRAQ